MYIYGTQKYFLQLVYHTYKMTQLSCNGNFLWHGYFGTYQWHGKDILAHIEAQYLRLVKAEAPEKLLNTNCSSGHLLATLWADARLQSSLAGFTNQVTIPALEDSDRRHHLVKADRAFRDFRAVSCGGWFLLSGLLFLLISMLFGQGSQLFLVQILQRG